MEKSFDKYQNPIKIDFRTNGVMSVLQKSLILVKLSFLMLSRFSDGRPSGCQS